MTRPRLARLAPITILLMTAAVSACTASSPEDEGEGASSTSQDSLVSPGWSATRPGYHGTEPLPAHVAYLTFDDGPSEWTEQFLDILRDESVKGTFFINARNLKKNGLTAYAATLNRMIGAGHAIGNHTLNHLDLQTLSADAVAFQLDENKRQINAALAPARTTFDILRPPYGSENSATEAVFSPRAFNTLWNIDSGDSANWASGEWFCDVATDEQHVLAGGGSPKDDDCVGYGGGGVSQAHPYDPSRPEYQAKIASVQARVLGDAHVTSGGGFISLMHDTHPTSRDALRGIIQGLKAKGYSFETVDDLRRRVYSGTCVSSTLAKNVAEDTCVRAASDAAWYICRGGTWAPAIPLASPCVHSFPYCSSSTLGRDVAARTCVQSKSDAAWYQCTDSGWVSGGSNGTGPLGVCSANFPLP